MESFPGGSVVKNLPAMKETGIWPLGWEDPLEKEIATHPSILAWEIPWTGEPSGPQSMRAQKVGYDWENFENKAKNIKAWTNG